MRRALSAGTRGEALYRSSGLPVLDLGPSERETGASSFFSTATGATGALTSFFFFLSSSSSSSLSSAKFLFCTVNKEPCVIPVCVRPLTTREDEEETQTGDANALILRFGRETCTVEDEEDTEDEVGNLEARVTQYDDDDDKDAEEETGEV